MTLTFPVAAHQSETLASSSTRRHRHMRIGALTLALLASLTAIDHAQAQIIGCDHIDMGPFFLVEGTDSMGSQYFDSNIAVRPVKPIYVINHCQFSDSTNTGVFYGLATSPSTTPVNITVNNGAAPGFSYWTGLDYAVMGNIDLSAHAPTYAAATNRVLITGGGIETLTGPQGTIQTYFTIQGGHIEALRSDSQGANHMELSGGTIGFSKMDGTTVISGGGIRSGTGNDTILLNGATVTRIDAGLTGDKTITLTTGKVGFNAVDAVITDGGVFTGAGNDNITLAGAAVARVVTGAGSDQVTIQAGNTMTGLIELDGNTGTNTLDIWGQTLTKNTATDEFFHGTSASGTVIRNFGIFNLNTDTAMTFNADRSGYTVDQINVNNTATLNLFDSRIVANEHVQIAPGAILTMRDAEIAGTGQTQIAAGGLLQAAGASMLGGNLDNQGIVDLRSSALPGNTLHVSGGYNGGGAIYLTTYLADDTSPTDRLIIDGAVTGVSHLYITPTAGSPGAPTTDGIVVVDAQPGAANADAFLLGSPLSAGLYSYGLFQAAAGETHAGSFVLKSNGLAPRVPVYLMGASAAQSLALSTIGSMRDRGVAYQTGVAAPIQDMSKTMDGNSWVRLRFQRIDVERGQFALDQKETLLHGGFNIQEKSDPGDGGGLLRRGVTYSFGYARSDTKDHARSQLPGVMSLPYTNVGEIETKAYSLGAYQTQFWNNGVYLDLVAQGSLLDSSLQDIETHNAATHGWNALLSAEIGRTLPFGANDWRWEPQLQVMWSKTEMDAFNDGDVFVSDISQEQFRARAGLWLFNNFSGQGPDGKSTVFYALFNVWHDFKDPARVRLFDGVHSLALEPDTVTTWGELGIGFQQPFSNERITLFGDIRGQQALSSGDRDGFSAQVGLKAEW